MSLSDKDRRTAYTGISASGSARIHAGHQFITNNYYNTKNSDGLRDKTKDSKKLTDDEITCLRSLYQSDYRQHKARNPKRVAGTCEWVLEHGKYVNWAASTSSSLLWISADAGCGKSVLASFLIDKWSHDLNPDDTIICYFFFKDDNAEQRTSSAAFSALLHQILMEDIKLIKHVSKQFQFKGVKFAQEFLSLWTALNAIVSDPVEGKNIVCILDGLDECEKDDRIQMIESLQKLYSASLQNSASESHFLKFLITSRPGVLVEDTFFDLPTIRLRAEDENLAISHDIGLVVEDTISQIGRRRHIPADQQAALVKQIVDNADRTFLWVTLVLQRITNSGRFTKQALRELIETTPPDIDGVYDKILSESSEDKYTRKLLQIVVGAFRPLTLVEVNTALCIDPKNKSELELDLEPNIEATVKALCGVFLRINESTVYLAHQTAREFLLSPVTAEHSLRPQSFGVWKHSFEVQDVHHKLARICNFYLHFDEFDKNPLMVDPAEGDAFLKGKADEYADKFTFLHYAARYWPVHFRNARISPQDDDFSSFLWLYKVGSNSFKTWWQLYWVTIYNYSLGPEKTSPMILAAYLGHTEVLKRLIETKHGMPKFRTIFAKLVDIPINAKDDDDMTALTWAASEGHTETVQLLLQQWGISINHKDSMMMTPFLRACRYGHLEVVKLFLARRETDINAYDDRWQSCLSYACSSGNISIVKLLLDRKDIDINKKNRYGGTAVNFAVTGGVPEIVKELLDRAELEIDFNHPSESPLAAAAKKGNMEIYDMLLSYAERRPGGFNVKATFFAAVNSGSDIVIRSLLRRDPSLLNSQDGDGYTPLANACKSLLPHSVKILLAEPGIDVNPIDHFGRTPLTWAICWRGGSYEIVDMLLACRNIIADHKDHKGETPLAHAAGGGHEAVVRSLLSRSDVELDSKDVVGDTPFLKAALYGHPSIIEQFLFRPELEYNVQGYTGMTALAWAAERGHTSVVELLLAKPVDTTIANDQGKTALAHAIRNAHRDVANLLIKHELKQSGIDLNNLTEAEKQQVVAAMNAVSPEQSGQYSVAELFNDLGLA